MALVLPLLLILVMGIIQFGMVFSQTAGLANAARSGARVGSVHLLDQVDCQGVVDATREQALAIGMDPANVAVEVGLASGAADVSSAATTCLAPKGSNSVLSGGATEPCDKDDTSPQKIVVTAEFDAVINLAFVPAITFPRAVSGVYRCEY